MFELGMYVQIQRYLYSREDLALAHISRKSLLCCVWWELPSRCTHISRGEEETKGTKVGIILGAGDRDLYWGVRQPVQKQLAIALWAYLASETGGMYLERSTQYCPAHQLV